ncbi:hypothetical protein PanWU01x14_193010, partial [Parasponia andersonii]
NIQEFEPRGPQDMSQAHYIYICCCGFSKLLSLSLLHLSLGERVCMIQTFMALSSSPEFGGESMYDTDIHGPPSAIKTHNRRSCLPDSILLIYINNVSNLLSSYFKVPTHIL